MGNVRYGTRQSDREPPILSNQLQQNLCNPIRAKPQVGIGFVNVVVSLWLLCLIVGEEDCLIVWKCVVFDCLRRRMFDCFSFLFGSVSLLLFSFLL